jgi:hypothetical protein
MQIWPFLSLLLLFSCTKKVEMPVTETFQVTGALLDQQSAYGIVLKQVSLSPEMRVRCSEPISGTQDLSKQVSFKTKSGQNIDFTASLAQQDSVLVIKPRNPLTHLESYIIQINKTLSAQSKKLLSSQIEIVFQTQIDTTPKFPLISDDSLMTLVQRQHFKYFYDYGHPVSGLSPERNSTPGVVTSGGSGFGVMAIIVGVHRGFITRAEGAARIKVMTDFLRTKAIAYHGTFPHWIDGQSGATIPFSPKDNGADLVETSYLMQGLLCARQYFDSNDASETALRTEINTLYQSVEWDWFTRGGQQVLYWHWSPNYAWEMNHQIRGWNECLVTYIMAASSPTHTINKSVYEQGFAQNGAMKNGKSFYGYPLPLGSDLGGPLFFAHYSFLGVDPRGLSDQYADYQVQTLNHTRINYAYCVANPKQYTGYSADCWGLTASDTYDGYTAHEPNNDRSVISPTAALSSMPYTPAESKAAMRYFYYVLGDKIWLKEGFADAFSLDQPWFTNQTLAIDQGPIVIMIENHRSGLLWQLFTSCPEVKVGMKKLGFVAPYLP